MAAELPGTTECDAETSFSTHREEKTGGVLNGWRSQEKFHSAAGRVDIKEEDLTTEGIEAVPVNATVPPPQDKEDTSLERTDTETSQVQDIETYKLAVQEMLASVRDSSEVELLATLLKSITGIWDGLNLVANLCPLWAQHTDNRQKSNLFFHRLEIHDASKTTRLIGYYAIVRNFRLHQGIEQRACLLETFELLDAIRCVRSSCRSSEEAGATVVYVPLTRETLAREICSKMQYDQRNEEMISVPDQADNTSGRLPNSRFDIVEEPAQNLMRLLDRIQASLETFDTHAVDGDISTNSDELTVTREFDRKPFRETGDRFKPVGKKRQKTTATSSQQDFLDTLQDRSSPCQGVCWDPTHQRWVAHWSDSRTHQRIRRYFNPKLIGFQNARLLSVMTRREAVDSGRASMISRSERMKSIGHSSSPTTTLHAGVNLSPDDPSNENYVRGVYWCPSSMAWYAYWRREEELIYRAFLAAEFLDAANQDLETAILLARNRAIEFRQTITNQIQTQGMFAPATSGAAAAALNDISSNFIAAAAAAATSIAIPMVKVDPSSPVTPAPAPAPASHPSIPQEHPSPRPAIVPTKVVYVSSPPSRPKIHLNSRLHNTTGPPAFFDSPQITLNRPDTQSTVDEQFED